LIEGFAGGGTEGAGDDPDCFILGNLELLDQTYLAFVPKLGSV
jgi:hypothetical protein